MQSSGGPSNSLPSSPACVPFLPPQGSASLQEYCKYLTTVPDSTISAMYRNASSPVGLSSQTFPLTGCVLGCIVGKESFSRGLTFGAGAWSGKCFDKTVTTKNVVNLLTPLPLGGFINVLDSFNWSSLLPTYSQYPGDLAVGPSWFDAMGLLNNGGRIGPSWTILYDDVETPQLPINVGPLNNITSIYAELVRGTRDEMRLVNPGFVLGQMFRRPNSYLNPTPIPFNSQISFALFQVCDRNGGYAKYGNQRNLNPQPAPWG